MEPINDLFCQRGHEGKVHMTLSTNKIPKAKYHVDEPRFPLADKQYQVFKWARSKSLVSTILGMAKNYAYSESSPDLLHLKNKIRHLTRGLMESGRTKPAPRVESDTYLDFEGKCYYEIDYGGAVRPCLVLESGEEVVANLPIGDFDSVLLSIAVLEESQEVIEDNELNLEITVQVGDKQQRYSFSLPTYEKDHRPHWNEPISNHAGRGWLDLKLPVNVKEQAAKISVKGSYKTRGDTAIFGIGAVRALRTKATHQRNVFLFLCGESLLDFQVFRESFKQPLKTPNIDALIKESVHHSCTYSQGNWTVPSVHSMLTGLFPSQHNFSTRTPLLQGLGVNQGLKRLPELLRDAGFYTMAHYTQLSFYPEYGLTRGFDHYKYVPRKWQREAGDFYLVIKALEAHPDHDLALFLHFDKLHKPFISTGTGDDLRVFNIQRFEKLLQEGTSPEIIAEQIESLDQELGVLISYLKNTKQYDNTMLVLTGDHGLRPPGWQKGSAYSDYEVMTRIPLIIKYPSSSGRPKGTVTDVPTNGSVAAFHETIDVFGIEPPSYLDRLSGGYGTYRGMAITETLNKPKAENYSISLRSEGFKYWLKGIVDWKKFEFIEIEDERLFLVDPITKIADESSEELENHPKEAEFMREAAKRFIVNNLQFQRDFPLEKL